MIINGLTNAFMNKEQEKHHYCGVHTHSCLLQHTGTIFQEENGSLSAISNLGVGNLHIKRLKDMCETVGVITLERVIRNIVLYRESTVR